MLSALAGLWQVAGHLLTALMWADTPQRVAVLTVAVLAVAVVGCLAASASLAGATAGLPVLRRVAALREKSWRAAFLRQRDPDARGRARPRAPYLTVVIAAFAPLAAAVYLVVSTGWSVAERWLFNSSRRRPEFDGAPPRAGHTLRNRAHRS